MRRAIVQDQDGPTNPQCNDAIHAQVEPQASLQLAACAVGADARLSRMRDRDCRSSLRLWAFNLSDWTNSNLTGVCSIMTPSRVDNICQGMSRGATSIKLPTSDGVLLPPSSMRHTCSPRIRLSRGVDSAFLISLLWTPWADDAEFSVQRRRSRPHANKVSAV